MTSHLQADQPALHRIQAAFGRDPAQCGARCRGAHRSREGRDVGGRCAASAESIKARRQKRRKPDMTTVVLGCWRGRHGHGLVSQQGRATIVESLSSARPRRRWRRAGAMAASSMRARSSPGRSRACRCKIINWLGKENAPLLLRYGAIPHMWRWGLDFARNCTPERFARTPRPISHLALHSLKSLQEIGAETGIEYDRATSGVMKIYRSKEALDRRRALQRHPRAAWPALSSASTPKRCVELEPALADTSPTLGRRALFCPRRGRRLQQIHARPGRALCGAWRQISTTATTVQRIETSGGRVTGVITDKGRIAADQRRRGDGQLHRAAARASSASACRSIR